MSQKKCMVFETLGKVSDLQISEGVNNEVRLSGVFGVCGVKNQNNRIYDKDNYRAMVESLQQVIATEGCPGELEHPNSMNINLENVSHKIESIEIDENGTVTGTILLLNTPKGQIAKAIVEGGLPLFISSRGAGTITNEGRVTLSNIKTYDLVGTPGFAQAKLSLKENQTLECLNESLDENGNTTWVIIDESQINEGDDLLDGLDDDDKADDKKEDKKDSKEENKDKKEEKEEKSDDADKKDKSDDDKKEEKDNKDIEDKVTMNELKEAIEKLTDKVTSLEAELHVAQESLAEIQPVNYDAIEKWVNEEFKTEFTQTIEESIDAKIAAATEEITESVDEKINETVEAISEGVQNWCTNEFAPVVEGWVTNEFAPVVEGWVTNEFAPVMESYMNDEFAPAITESITSKVNENVNAFMESNKAGRLDEIDSILESIGTSTEVEKIIAEEKTASKFKGVYVVEHMPAQYAPSWQMLNEERQDEIVRSSKMYDFTKQGVLESFWASVDFVNEKKEETKTVDVVESYHSNVAAQMKRFGKW